MKSALKHRGWRQAMQELAALYENATWTLVPRHVSMNVVGSKWVIKTKLKADGSLERLKAQLVVKGYNQIEGVDFNETFSPVMRPQIIRLVLIVALSCGWEIHKLDIKNAFLHGFLKESVYMGQPPGFKGPSFPHHVCELSCALYGLKQALRAWFD